MAFENFDITCKTAEVTPFNDKAVKVWLNGARVDDILSAISIADAIEYYGEEHLLKEIGHVSAQKFFNL